MRIETVSDVALSPSPAVEAFLHQFGKVASAYEYDWSKQASFAQRAAHLSGGGYLGDRKAVAAALEAYNRALGADETVLANIRQLGQESTLAVVTGQQAGILTGPAYSIYKAITVIHLARQQSELLGTPVVPVFWVAAEDHDWLEVASVLAPSVGTTVRLTLKEPLQGDRRSVGLAPAPPSAAEVVEEFAALLPESEFKGTVVEQVRAALMAPPALDPSLTEGKASLVDWFARLMTTLFAGTGLIIVNPSDPAIRRLESAFFQRAIERHEQVDHALSLGYDRWESLGFAPTLDRQVGNLNLFTYVNGERLPLVGAGDHFWVRDRQELRWSKAELIDQAATHPELFSTNVVLRPVVQGYLFPDLAYVGGPGEVAYFGLYRDVFAAVGQQMPIVYPRESFTLVEPPIARIMEKQELSFTDVLYRLDEKKQELLEREDRLGITGLFEQFRTSFGQDYAGLVAKLLELDPNLQFVAEENRKQISVQINKLEEKAQQQHRKNSEVAIRQFERLRAQLTPSGLQERAVTILPYLAKYGPDLVLQLIDAAELTPAWAHRAVYLGG